MIWWESRGWEALMNYIKKAKLIHQQQRVPLHCGASHTGYITLLSKGVQYQLPSPEKLGQQVNFDNSFRECEVVYFPFPIKRIFLISHHFNIKPDLFSLFTHLQPQIARNCPQLQHYHSSITILLVAMNIAAVLLGGKMCLN